METMTLTVKSANRLRTRAIERTMLGVSLRDHIQNEELGKRTKVDDVIEHIRNGVGWGMWHDKTMTDGEDV